MATLAPRPRTFLPILASLALLPACAQASPTGTASASVQATPAPTATPGTVYPLTLTDDAGRELTLAADPERIVSLAPSNTEIACALEACDELVGVTDFDDYPPEVADIEKVVTFAQVDVEKVVAAEPDLVLAAGNEQTPTAVIEQLDDLGLTVMVLYPETLVEVYADIGLVGEALDESGAAEQLVTTMQSRVAGVEEAVAATEHPSTFYEVSIFEGVIYTAGEDSFLASLIDTAGGEPITGDAQGVIQLEDLVVADPQLILLGDAAYDATITPRSVRQRQGWREITAVREGAIKPVLEDVLITRPGPRIVDGLEALARAIHPEAFD